MTLLYDFLHNHRIRAIVFHIALIALSAYGISTVLYYQTCFSDARYIYRGSGVFTEEIGNKIWKTSGYRSAEISYVDDGKVWVTYEFGNSNPHKYGLIPVHRDKTYNTGFRGLSVFLSLLVVLALGWWVGYYYTKWCRNRRSKIRRIGH
jgi:hypothetical protein